MGKPDQSYYLVHFTKNGKNYGNEEVETKDIAKMSARQRLLSILENRVIECSSMPWTNTDAVCFTECPWSSFVKHSENYSPYGIGFTKKLIYSRNGNPVFYVNPKIFKAEKWSRETYQFVTPFVPSYANPGIKESRPFLGKAVDYSHEREWRVTKDFSFQYKNVQFVILNSITDLQLIDDRIIEEIGYDKFIFMSMYKKIEELWPTHVLK